MPQYFLDSVGINGFRGLRNLRLEGIGPLNILVGQNNSGKTSVLEALSILCNPNNPFEWLEMVRRRDFGRLDETRIQSLRWCFPQRVDLADPELLFKGSCELTSFGTFPLRSLRVEYSELIGEPGDKAYDRLIRNRKHTDEAVGFDEPWNGVEIVHHIESVTDPTKPNLFDSLTHSTQDSATMLFWEEDPMVGSRLRDNYRRQWKLPSFTLTPYSYQINIAQLRSQSRHLFSSESRRETVLELIRQFDPDIMDIQVASFRGKRSANYLEHRHLGPAPLSIFGDAIRRAVLLANTLLSLKRGGVLLIDELETGIHVSALERVFVWLANLAKEFDVQVFATTHSLEAVDAMAQSVSNRIDDLVTFHLDQTETETRVKRIAGELLLRLRRERALDVR